MTAWSAIFSQAGAGSDFIITYYRNTIVESTKMVVFKGKNIRKIIFKNEWWFVISDVFAVLTDSKDPSGYIKNMRRRDPELAKGYGQIVHTLSIDTEGGVQRMNCANTEGIFRIIQSIPSPKAEPFDKTFFTVFNRIEEVPC